MARRNNSYVTVRQTKRKTENSSPNPGKRTTYFTVGGRGINTDLGQRCGGGKFWNPGKTRPSKQYKRAS